MKWRFKTSSNFALCLTRFNILEHRGAVGRLRHHRKAEPALRAGLRQYLLFAFKSIRLIRYVCAAGAHADQAGVLQLEVGDDIFHDGPASDGPFFGVLVVSVHVPVPQGLEAGPDTDLVVPGGVLWV